MRATLAEEIVTLDESYAADAPLFFHAGRNTILRKVDADNAFLADPALRRELQNAGVVDYEPVTCDGVDYFETVPFFFPNSASNWSSGMYRDYLRLWDTLDDVLKALDLSLIDGHCFNVVYYYGRPTFVDLGSIRKGRNPHGPGEARSYRKALLSYRMTSARRTRRRLDREVEGPRYRDVIADLVSPDDFVSWRSRILRLAGVRTSSIWKNYYTAMPETYADIPKETVIRQILAEARPDTVYDIGCNTGHYSLMAESTGASVVGCDPDPDSVDYLYQRVAQSGARILPLVADLDGFVRAIQRSYARLRPKSVDMVFLLALTHHLAYKGNIDFEAMFDRIAAMGARSAVIELVSKKDANVAAWDRKNPLEWYSLEELRAAGQRRFESVTVFDQHDPERPIVLFRGARG